MQKHFVARSQGHGRLPEQRHLGNIARRERCLTEGVALQGDGVAKGEGNGRFHCRRRSGRHGIHHKAHILHPLIGRFEGMFVQPALNPTLRVLLRVAPVQHIQAIMLRGDDAESGGYVGFGHPFQRQRVHRRALAVVISKHLPLVGRVENNPGVGVAVGGDARRHAPIIGAGIGGIGVEVVQGLVDADGIGQ